jgi:hypothetical protein
LCPRRLAARRRPLRRAPAGWAPGAGCWGRHAHPEGCICLPSRAGCPSGCRVSRRIRPWALWSLLLLTAASALSCSSPCRPSVARNTPSPEPAGLVRGSVAAVGDSAWDGGHEAADLQKQRLLKFLLLDTVAVQAHADQRSDDQSYCRNERVPRLNSHPDRMQRDGNSPAQAPPAPKRLRVRGLSKKATAGLTRPIERPSDTPRPGRVPQTSSALQPSNSAAR